MNGDGWLGAVGGFLDSQVSWSALVTDRGLKTSKNPVLVAHTFNFGMKRSRQRDLCEFEASLLYIVRSWTVRATYTVRPCLKTPTHLLPCYPRERGKENLQGEQSICCPNIW